MNRRSEVGQFMVRGGKNQLALGDVGNRWKCWTMARDAPRQDYLLSTRLSHGASLVILIGHHPLESLDSTRYNHSTALALLPT
jgi:hypothetical protein